MTAHTLLAAATLVVIAPRDWLPALAGYLEHRRGQMAVEAVALEDVLRDAPGADEPERVKRWLFARWTEKRCDHALLVGDAAHFPVRWMTLDRVTKAAFDTAFYPSDLYYGDLARADGAFDDWNAQHDGAHALYFGEVHGEHHKQPPVNFDAISYVPEIGVGRWPARTPDEAAALAKKTVLFDGAARGRRGVAFVHKDGWVDERARLAQLVGALRGPSAALLADEPEHAVDAAALVKLFAEGTRLVVHCGHGSPAEWGGCFALGDLPRIAELPPGTIAASAGCDTAVIAAQPPYDPYVDVLGIEHPGTNAGEVFATWPPPPACLQRGRFVRDSLGQAFVRGPGPVVAYFGCDTGAQPCAVTLVEELARGMESCERLGDAWKQAIARYVEREKLREIVPTEDWYPASVFFQGMKFVVLGDPSLPCSAR